MRPVDEIVRHSHELGRSYPRLPQPVYGPRGEPLRLRPRVADAEHADERRLREGRVLAGRLPELDGACRGVEDVVADLEGEPQVGAVAAQRGARGRYRPSGESPDHAGGGDQRAGLAAVDLP